VAKTERRDHIAGCPHRPALRFHFHHVRSHVLSRPGSGASSARDSSDGPDSPGRSTASGPGIETFDLWHLPLINTLILLMSALRRPGRTTRWSMRTTAGHEVGPDPAIGLSALFTVFQIYEYSHATFGFSANIYGAELFMATFPRVHVFIGTIFLAVCLFRL
jgi:cytochrome c oxidase subunit 3